MLYRILHSTQNLCNYVVYIVTSANTIGNNSRISIPSFPSFLLMDIERLNLNAEKLKLNAEKLKLNAEKLKLNAEKLNEKMKCFQMV